MLHDLTQLTDHKDEQKTFVVKTWNNIQFCLVIVYIYFNKISVFVIFYDLTIVDQRDAQDLPCLEISENVKLFFYHLWFN